MGRRLAAAGHVVLAPTFGLPEVPGYDWDADPHGIRDRLARMHLERVRLADEVHVVDPGGYVGESTRREIELAESLGILVRYLSRGWETSSRG